MYIDLLCITIIIVIITDLTDWPNTIYKMLSRLLTKGKIVTSNMNIHLISCSLCQTHWAGLLYLILTNSFTFPNYLYVLALAFFTTVFKDALIVIKDALLKLINKL